MYELVLSSADVSFTTSLKTRPASTAKHLQYIQNREIDKGSLCAIVQLSTFDYNLTPS